ncbi:helix-turn-helix transcriptional regulator [Thomasclavelia sp.]|uniref:helix-turn-helix domain-containing protein n=1 Tax=Thomasclavelia sp. TaxID=3025757 RepID=UPI0025F61911|nr:helix-turn-helix transcriptional regulator [Thomasclavelia sp.]
MEKEINEIKSHIGARIKSLRIRNKLSQIDLANKAGVSKAIISAYENNIRMPSIDILIKLSLIFDVPVGIFFYKPTKKEENTIDVSGLTSAQIAVVETVVRSFKRDNKYDEKF